MTNEEAIAELTDIFNNVLDETDAITTLAFTKAIEALESIDRIKAERDAAIADLNECETVNMSCFYCKHYEYCRDSKDVLKNKDGTPCNQGIDLWEWRGIQYD